MLIFERLEHLKKSWFFDANYLSDSLAIPKKNCAYAQSFSELPIPIPIPMPIPSKFSEKRMTHSPIPIRSGLRWGWVFLERTRILSGIQFTTYFIDFFVVETKRFVSSFVNVILTRQTCGQRSSRAVESKRRGIGNYFSSEFAICSSYQNVEETEIQVCTQLRYLRLENRSAMATSEKKNVFWSRKNRILPLRCGSPNASTEVVHSSRSQSPLHFDMRNIQQIRSGKQFPSARRLLSAAFLERWPQVCRVKISCTKLLTNRFVSTTKNSMNYVVNWIPLRIRVLSRNTQPHVKGSTKAYQRHEHLN